MEKDREQAAFEKNLSLKQAEINQVALKRFLELEGKRKRALPTPRANEPEFKVRRSIINDYDGLAIERILNQSDLFPIAHLKLGLDAGRSICRLTLRSRSGRLLGYGTGFMVSPCLLLTNNHVLGDAETARYALAEFNYEDDEHFMPRPVDSFRLDPDSFFITSQSLDFTLTAVQDVSNTKCHLAEFGHLPLLAQAGKILEGEYVSIIQHPQGGPKAVTLRENQVRFLAADFIHYLTDTEPGSSGSPVFNDQWVVVALHHAGVPDPQDPSQWIANEGVRISSIAGYLMEQRSSLDALRKRLLDEVLAGAPGPGSGPVSGQGDNNMEVGELDPAWYEGAAGYEAGFLGEGFPVPLPEVKAELSGDIAQPSGDDKILHYTHFSILMSKSRRLAYYTASNIDGANRKDIKRSGDKWYYDPRISQAYQCGPALYSKNELDRGHLVRRLDPVWGEAADKANEDTFHFTNCSPQHKNLNQKTWLNLEDYILNNAGVHGLKVNVFTGPVFRTDDMVYRGEFKIPAEFWKVAVIVKADNTLSATAYLQTQKNLLTNLEFAYGAYETYQVPLAQIEALTGLSFGQLKTYDPLAVTEAGAARLIEGPDSLRL